MQKRNFCCGLHHSCVLYSISLKIKRGGFFIFLYVCSPQGLILLPGDLMQKFRQLNLTHNFYTSICSTTAAPPNPAALSKPHPSALICHSSDDFYVLFCSAVGSSGIFWPQRVFSLFELPNQNQFQTPLLLTWKKKKERFQTKLMVNRCYSANSGWFSRYSNTGMGLKRTKPSQHLF